ARKLVTSWGLSSTNLQDYAYREWSGLLDDYYAPRWQKLFEDLRTSMTTGQPVPTIDWYEIAESWSKDTSPYPTTPSGDPYVEATETFERLADDRFDVPLSVRTSGTVADDHPGR